MLLYRDYLAQPKISQAVALGAFDGLHLGHQSLINKARELAASVPAGLVSLVCFEPLPRQFFGRAGQLARLSTAGERLRVLRRMAVDQCWQLRFNAQLAATEAEDFVNRVLVQGLAAKHVVVGEDFRFGAKRRGDIQLLRQLGDEWGFQVHIVPPVVFSGERVSSTRIRSALDQGDLSLVRDLLGRPFCITGRVRHGQQLGRNLGYPTANIAFPGRKPPLAGIYAVRVRLHASHPECVPVPPITRLGDFQFQAELATKNLQALNSGHWVEGVASLGQRPTVNRGEPLLEVHLFDFCGDLYGRKLDVEFVQKLRDEAHFSTIPDMVAQIHDDAAQARQILRQG